jgi:hypothetical protein
LEAATKHFRVPILLSEATANRVQDRCCPIKLCQTYLPGIETPQAIHQLLERQPNVYSVQAAQYYSQALVAYEEGQWAACLEHLSALLLLNEGDRRADYLLEQVEQRALSDEVPELQKFRLRQRTRPAPLPDRSPFQALHRTASN